MRLALKSICLVVFAMILASGVIAQSGRGKQRGGDSKRNQPADVSPSPSPTPTVPSATPEPEEVRPDQGNETKDVEAVKVQTNLVTVPGIVSARNNIYVPDMRQEEFTLEENGVKQEISFFANVTQPFHVVLMLDTSASTQEKLSQIQRAASAFVDELQPQDRVKIISFDDRIKDHGVFTNNRDLLRAQISQIRSGRGTKLYDAMAKAMRALEPIQGRKAIVIFTDGVDSYSDNATLDENRRDLEEAGIIVYPIRYDTRAETERIVWEQQRRGQSVDLGSVLGGGGSGPTTPPANPGSSIPTPPDNSGGSPTIAGIPVPPIVIQTRKDPNRNDPYPGPSNDPTRPTSSGTDSNIEAMLNLMYSTADMYLTDLAIITGGKLHRADTLGSLPLAFANIAAELRTQYSIGYYPTSLTRDGKFRKIKVRSTRKGVVVRSRPGYRTPRG